MKAKYKYHARAVAISGSLTRPMAVDIGDLAAIELQGHEEGYDSKRLENHRIHEIFSVGAAYTQVTASEGPEGHFNTMATATIEKLNILDVLKADRITCRLVGLHCAEDFDCCEHPFIHPMGSTIENLTVAGKRLDFPHPEGFQLDFDKPHSYAAFKKSQHHYGTPGT
ncbi:MAG TPA: choice-of-anchor P family protein, partial [Bryobacteraceae bacterium]|nr:choice-of-anchor P family protein [Bryobacteraceae bacterium]